MLIVIEGPDGAGKSTLMNSLRLKFDRRAMFVTRASKPAGFNQLTDELIWLAMVPDTSIVFCDRHPYISEQVYGPILRDKSVFPEMSATTSLMYERMLGIVYCRPPRDTIKRQLMLEDHIPGVPQNIDRLIDAYDVLMAATSSQTNVLTYDYTSQPIDGVLTGVNKWIDSLLSSKSSAN